MMRLHLTFASLLALLALVARAAEWQPAKGPLLTRWAAEVSPARALPEYPRPQFARAQWLNLNGLWDYAITDRSATPAAWDGQILVPFPVESALSGVMKRLNENQRLWYRRTVRLPAEWAGQRIRLNFGAVDWEATVVVNGHEVGTHRGGYDPFSFDITDVLLPNADQEIRVVVWDPTDAGTQPRGKQVRNPNGIWYTPTTGIWQTAWIEPVNPTHIQSLRITPDLDRSSVTLDVALYSAAGLDARLAVDLLDGPTPIQSVQTNTAGSKGARSARVIIHVPNPKPWSPDSPFLYDLRLTLREDDRPADSVASYFGLRKIALVEDKDGVLRLGLNNQPLFQFGPLDQGFWPDGLYTAPTDDALRYDIEVTKRLGFNLARKHVKIEPDRWYYWCDKLGLLVWQDMPSGDRYIGGRDPDIQRTPDSARQFEAELRALVDAHFNHPSIVMWVPYNEGWGQWDTPRIVDLIRSWDATRLVNNTSGWTDRKVGDVNDVHAYPGPAAPPRETKRAGVLGEFGGLGLPVKGHTWQDERNWGYRSFKNPDDLTDAYLKLIDHLAPLARDSGLAAAVYTQTTDVEIEVNGLMTYDRAQIKMDAAAVAAANRAIYAAPAAPKVRQSGAALVPPATPLVACDPYFSIWSPADRLTDEATRHWTGRSHPLAGLARIDGATYRFLGNDPRRLPALTQTRLDVFPTRTVYAFAGAGVELVLTFLTPALPEDIDVLSRPVTYLLADLRATDGRTHEVALYFDASAELVVNQPQQPVVWSSQAVDDLAALKLGSRDQPILAKKGDDLRIDWGYLYLAAPRAHVAVAAFADRPSLERAFVTGGLRTLPSPAPNAPVNADQIAAALALNPDSVGAQTVTRWVLLAYDDLFSIQYLKNNLRPYWRRNGAEAADLIRLAARQLAELRQRCTAFDDELMTALRRVGGEPYARLAALAFRQCWAANKFAADANGQPLAFPKENFSNGCINTVDVIYPMAPQFLLFGPSLTKAMLVPILDYAASPRWKWPFAPHDLGTYPHANGQVYGGGERTEENQMPVEETGNMLILLGALAQIEGNAEFALRYWPTLDKWADYLKAKGFDPENQLCTDDFAGHLAHNVNLSAKAICGLGAYAKLCALKGDAARADAFGQLARDFAVRWVQDARDGDHFKLAFDRPGTWSQKYNLVWDRILGLGLFPPEVLRTEMDYYRRIQNTYGLPLDNRQPYTKLDWTLWTATLTGTRADFDALVAPVYRFLNETPTRVPMTDWFYTHNARAVGFQARSVVGGVFIPMLYDAAAWKQWAARDRTRAANWAPLPTPPLVTTLLPTAQSEPATWRFSTTRPGNRWFTADFDDSQWQSGPAGFGTRGTPGATVRTEWSSADIWLRRTVGFPDLARQDIQLLVHHDEDAAIYINGTLAAQLTGYTVDYETVPLIPGARAALRPGPNLVAVHCRQTGGGQYIDLGFVAVKNKD